MQSVPPVEDPKSPLQNLRRTILAIAYAASAMVIGWPLGDLVYRAHFGTPGLWWVGVLVALATWITWTVLYALDIILTQLDQADSRMEELVDAINDYGAQREQNGHQLASHINGTVRQLHTVD